MHRNNRKKFINNYKHINIHKYKNCLYGNNINKIYSYIRHYFNKHNIKYVLNSIQIYNYTYENDIETFNPTIIYIDIKNINNKWVKTFKLICEENEVILKIDKL